MIHSAASASALQSSTRRPLGVFAALGVLIDLSVTLPGNPDFASTRVAVGCLAVQALIVWRLSRQSQVAWLLGFGLPVLAVLAIYLAAVPLNVSTVLFLLFCGAQAASLVRPPIIRSIWLRRAPLLSRPAAARGGHSAPG